MAEAAHFQDSFSEHLKADVGVSGLAGSRVYPNKGAQDGAVPYVWYRKISGPTDYEMGGETGWARQRWEVNVVGASYGSAWNLAKAVKAAISGFSGTMGTANTTEVDGVLVEDERDFYADDHKDGRHTVQLDLVIMLQIPAG